MKKLALMAFVSVMLAGAVAAQGQTPNTVSTNQAPNGNMPSDVQPTTPDKPSTAPSKGLSGILPKQASPVAKQVLNTVDEFLADPGKALGNALKGLLGNGQAANITER